MTRRALLFSAATLIGASASGLALAESKPGSFGFAIEVDGEGFFLNPTVKSVVIKSVIPGRPASDAGFKAGDQIVEVEGKQVAGGKANDLEPYLKRNVGEKVTLKLRKPSGEFYSATLVSASKSN